MDPAATIAACLAGTMSRRDAIDALRSWYGRQGFHPTLAQVAAILDRQGETPSRNWKARARALGAVDA